VLASIFPPAVGGPHLVTGIGWDPAPLILAAAIAAVLHRGGVPLGLPTLIAALLGGLALDLLTDVFTVSLAVVIAILMLAFSVVSLKRRPTR
jgi:hypothetical protein